jgi:hypothetical protein
VPSRSRGKKIIVLMSKNNVLRNSKAFSVLPSITTTETINSIIGINHNRIGLKITNYAQKEVSSREMKRRTA